MATTLPLLAAVIARLQARFPGLRVDYFPDQPENYRMAQGNGALLVSYLGSRFAASVDVGCIAQPRTVKLSVVAVLRQLNAAGGAVDTLDEVRRALVGWTPPGSGKLTALSEKCLGQAAGWWQYAIDFQTDALQLEAAEDEIPVLLNTVNLEESP